MAAALLVIVLAVLTVAAFAAVGHLHRIADAIEAQNKHYRVGEEAPLAALRIVNEDGD